MATVVRQGCGPQASPCRDAAGRPRPAPQKDLPFTGDVRPGELPPVNLLQLADHRTAVDGNELVRLGETIRTRCAEFGVDGSVEGISPGR
jgi:hypothetical protein